MYEDISSVHILTSLYTGGELYERLAIAKQKWTERQAAKLIRNILEGISQCHLSGVVHRDLKASNFVFSNLSTNTDIRIIDFGMVQIRNHNNQYGDEKDSLEWILKSRVGTPYYVAPEVLSEDSFYTCKCDIWSVGVIAYLTLSGSLPFCGKDERETLQLVQNPKTKAQFSDPIWKSYSPAARAFCRSLLQKDPTQRPTAQQALKLEWLQKDGRNSHGQYTRRFLTISFAVAFLATILSILTSGELSVGTEENLRSLAKDKTILITGANSGLGLATARLLAKTGSPKKIILACRNTSKCNGAINQLQQELPESAATQIWAIKLDLANRTSITDGAMSLQTILESSNSSKVAPALDILINNAGVAFCWSSKEFIQGIEMHLSINHLGHVLFTHLVWKNLLESSYGGRIVTVSSLGALWSWRDMTSSWYHNNDRAPRKNTGGFFDMIDSILCYFHSKRANLSFAWELHQRHYSSGDSIRSITSVASHPGYTRSDIMLKWRLPLVPDFVKEFLKYNRVFSMSTEEGAQTQLWAALAANQVPSGSLVGPKFWLFGKPVLVGSLLSRFCTHFFPFSKEESAKLWDQSLRELGISEFGVLETDET